MEGDGMQWNVMGEQIIIWVVAGEGEFSTGKFEKLERDVCLRTTKLILYISL